MLGVSGAAGVKVSDLVVESWLIVPTTVELPNITTIALLKSVPSGATSQLKDAVIAVGAAPDAPLAGTVLVNAGRARYLWTTLVPMLFVTTTTLTAGFHYLVRGKNMNLKLDYFRVTEEGRKVDGAWTGLTSNYIEVRFAGPEGLGRRFATVRLTEADRCGARGVLVAA